MEVTVKIFRYNPEKDARGNYVTYKIEAEPTDRILDVLEHIKGKTDGALSFRRSCAHGVCGSDAMRINGRNRLACKVLVRDVGANITIEPLLGMKVKKDLIVDMEPFFNNYKKMTPYLVNNSPLPADGRERLQSPEQRARFDESTKCILCAACTTSCPSFWANDEYFGPAAFVTAHRFIFDSRDEGASQRLMVLAETDGTVRCHTAYNCTDACPREIHITQAIGDLKMAMVTGKLE
ncbi:MAG: succinate dehydrogenase iron-sulfur subunit [Chloroflexi bacterium]|nr:succinate dehydrogenase iron-sulfur subunit [Chloroflexi bacterium CFX1]MCK6568137.1 succinate dehydrogenase iron-sulfur subunit [Anaerolineales bacterium]MCQ3954504.1 succinate dehydrogenase iron-sulfur subunit [Chloroflexota bacterium]MDL1919276.1 succinate dehydrogenase iron-sulfur subunit [Chloroflexi bacterium CFX5]NUQ60505.1 succinate dehydrogenase iron-sulfur subunit [Anaerolineales bacterium]